MNNINTIEYWDNNFKDEYEVMAGRKDGYIRWNIGRLHFVSEEIKTAKGTILDLGCGLGHMVRFLKARFPFMEVYGTDFSPFAIDKAKQLSNDGYFQASCYRFYKQCKDFDYIVCTEVLEHIDNPDKFMKAVVKGLKVGGKFILTTPIKSAYAPAEDHVNEYDREGIIDLLEKYLVNVTYMNHHPEQLLTGIKK